MITLPVMKDIGNMYITIIVITSIIALLTIALGIYMLWSDKKDKKEKEKTKNDK